MKRKVIQIAESTQLISLPRKWAIENNIKKGDELEVIPQGKQLAVHVGNSVVVEKTSLDVTKNEVLLERFIASAYRGGYDEVEVLFRNPEIMKRIDKVINLQLLGFEVIFHGEKRCVIKNISANLENEFDNILRRTMIILLDMAKSSYEAIEQGKPERLHESISSENTINRFCIFLERLLNKNGVDNFKKTNFLFTTAYQLEKIGDEYKYICTYLLDNKKIKLSKETMVFFKRVNDYLDLFYHHFYKYNPNDLEKLVRERTSIINDLRKLFLKVPKEESIVVHNLMNVVQLTYNLAGYKLGMEL